MAWPYIRLVLHHRTVPPKRESLSASVQHFLQRTAITALPGVLLISLLGSVNSFAGEFEIGRKAFQAGQYQTAGEHWQRCSSSGDANCQYGLGVLFDEGHDRPQDSLRALHWYKRAALGGSREAQIQLGFIYAIGREGISQKPVQAYVWFSMAANNGAKNASKYRHKIAQLLSEQELEQAHKQLLTLGIQYHLQK